MLSTAWWGCVIFVDRCSGSFIRQQCLQEWCCVLFPFLFPSPQTFLKQPHHWRFQKTQLTAWQIVDIIKLFVFLELWVSFDRKKQCSCRGNVQIYALQKIWGIIFWLPKARQDKMLGSLEFVFSPNTPIVTSSFPLSSSTCSSMTSTLLWALLLSSNYCIKSLRNLIR